MNIFKYRVEETKYGTYYIYCENTGDFVDIQFVSHEKMYAEAIAETLNIKCNQIFKN